MASTQLSTTASEEQVIEAPIISTPVEEKPAVEEAGGGFWGTLRWRSQMVFGNYMGLLGQVGLYGSTDGYEDP